MRYSNYLKANRPLGSNYTMKTTTAILWGLLIGSTIFLATTGHLRWLAPLTLAIIGLGLTACKRTRA